MAYTPTQWSPGDSITSAKLNKIENGIADNNGGIFWVTVTVNEGKTNSYTLNKTVREIIEAGESKIVVLKGQMSETSTFIGYYTGWQYNEMYILSFSSNTTFFASSLDDYPTNQTPSSDSGGTIK